MEHFDAAGEPCRAADAFRSVVTTEPEWDEASRNRVLRLTEYEAGMCPCGCGNQLDVALDETQAFKVDTFTCRARKAIEQVKRTDKKSKEKGPEGWSDGMTWFAVPVDDNRPTQKRGEPDGA